MIIFSKNTKKEIKKIKDILKIARDTQDVYNALDLIYERISNRPEKEYSKKYGLAEILKSKTLKEFKKEFYYNSTRFLGGVILEIVAYKQAPQGITILYNEFNQLGEQAKFEIFILKEKTKGEYNSKMWELQKEKIQEQELYDFLDEVFESYDYSDDLKQIVDTYIEDITIGNGEEAVEQEVKTMKHEFETMTEKDFCIAWGIYKIGNTYIKP